MTVRALRGYEQAAHAVNDCVRERLDGAVETFHSRDELSVLTNMTVEGGLMTGVVEPCQALEAEGFEESSHWLVGVAIRTADSMARTVQQAGEGAKATPAHADDVNALAGHRGPAYQSSTDQAWRSDSSRSCSSLSTRPSFPWPATTT